VRIVKKITRGWQIWGEASQAPRRGRGWRGGVSLPNKGGAWGGGCASSSEIFLTFWLKIVHFGVYSGKNR